MSIATNLPPAPEDSAAYILSYSPVAGDYFLTCCADSSNTYTYNSDTSVLSCGSNTRYCLSDGAWVQYANSRDWVGVFLSEDDCTGPTHKVILSSSVNIVSSDNRILKASVPYGYFNHRIALVGDTLTASDFSPTLLGVQKLVPLLLPLIIGYLAFRKAWQFIRSTVKGA